MGLSPCSSEVPTMGLSPCSSEVPTVALVLLFLSSAVLCDCPTPVLPLHSKLRTGELQDTYPTATVLRLTCIIAYEPIPGKSNVMTCLTSGNWADTPTFCQGKRCPPPHLENGRITSSNDLRLGDTVTLACDPEFRMIGNGRLRCILRSGKVDWNRELPYCEPIPCARPAKISNGKYDPESSDLYIIGSVIVYRCNADYSLIGNSTITCLVAADGLNGEWNSHPPECKKVSCMRPTIANGRVTKVFQPKYTYGNDLSFECNSGYTLVGAAFVKCDANSKWNPPVPRCVKTIVSTTTKPTGLPPIVPPHTPAPRPRTPAAPPPTPAALPPIPSTPVPPEEDKTKEIPVVPTQSETIPTDGSGSGKIAGIVIGIILAIIVLAALIFAAMKWLYSRRTDSTPGASKKDIALEKEKKIGDHSRKQFQRKTSKPIHHFTSAELRMGTP